MWIVVGVAAWMVVAALVGVLIGRTIRARETQIPRDVDGPPVGRVPTQQTELDDVPPVAGRTRSHPS